MQSPERSRRNVVIVSVPPDILDYPTSTDMVVREGSNVTLRCAATGTPEPTVTWRREAGGTISLSNWHEGTYLCAIASSDVNWVYLVKYRWLGLGSKGFLSLDLCVSSNPTSYYYPASHISNVIRSWRGFFLFALK